MVEVADLLRFGVNGCEVGSISGQSGQWLTLFRFVIVVEAVYKSNKGCGRRRAL